ncbi:hypothetical protein FNV43_RR02535 [Rhamnella rubrinervis]|uniref:Uncharacterized protein n=1 Tax=Rhamnella rubrinervis TaxID=2594499 RepID=A0A8K0HTN2_9ROSA|nr:hypothetical protein FNV43_RR02535 [Rhamnella rubrinervis]
MIRFGRRSEPVEVGRITVSRPYPRELRVHRRKWFRLIAIGFKSPFRLRGVGIEFCKELGIGVLELTGFGGFFGFGGSEVGSRIRGSAKESRCGKCSVPRYRSYLQNMSMRKPLLRPLLQQLSVKMQGE